MFGNLPKSNLDYVLLIISGWFLKVHRRKSNLNSCCQQLLHSASSRQPIPLLLTNCLVLKPAEELTVEKLMAVVEKAIAPNSLLLLPVGISSGTSKFSVLPVHCPARTMDCTRSFMAGMQMKANESAWLMYLLLFLFCITNDFAFVYDYANEHLNTYNYKFIWIITCIRLNEMKRPKADKLQ